MLPVQEFEAAFISSLPETYSLLSWANRVLHRRVQSVVLHGSRGPSRCFSPDSDIDLSLFWIHEATKDVDLAIIFDLQKCGLKCFQQSAWDNNICRIGGVDCFGLYKIQKGINRLVTNAGTQVRLMYPCIKIWQRSN